MEKLRLFFAAAFVAALTGCPTMPNPPVDSDTGTLPTDSGMPDVDAGTDPVDAYVPPGTDGGTDTDAGVIPSMCEDPEFIGNMCNLPLGMAYTRSEFICGTFLNNDLWITDGVGATPRREFAHEDAGVFYAELGFAYRNGGMSMRADLVPEPEFTCGNEGRCWLNWTNPDSNYSHCRVSFLTDCSVATTECWLPGSATPVVSYASYVGE